MEQFLCQLKLPLMLIISLLFIGACALVRDSGNTSSAQSPGFISTASAETTAAPYAPTPKPTSVYITPVFSDGAPETIPVYTYTIVNTYPHDPKAFTQGLVFSDGVLYEGTGMDGASSLRKVALETGAILQSQPLADTYFGEGIALFENKIYQLTWVSQVAFVYNKETFELLQQFTYPTEGWGLTHDGVHLIMSDGSATLFFRDPTNFEVKRQIEVTADGKPVRNLNELEYINGEIYANIWQTDRIARINAQTGHVVGWIDLAGLLSPEDRKQPVDVLNGIAYDTSGDRLFVTGKWWPKLFAITLKRMQ